MADSNKNIIITPATGTTSEPSIEFKGYDVNTTNIKLLILDDGSVSFEGGAGQLFSVNDSLTGTIFSVNDVSGIPSIEVIDDGTVKLAEYSGNILIGTATDSGYKLQVVGNTSLAGNLTLSGTVDGRDVATDGSKLDGIASGANNYTHPSYAGDDINIDTGALTGAVVISDLDFNITTDTSGHVTDANATVATRTLTLANLGYTGATNANYYTHPSYAGDDINLDTGALTGATVISDLDFNVTTDTLGHVTDANATYATRNLTYSDVGAAAASHTHNYISEGGTSFTGTYPVAVRVSANNFYSDADITFTGSTSILNTTGGYTVGGTNTVWHAGNDGSGSGLDADLLDGIQASSLLRSDVSDIYYGRVLEFGNAGNGSNTSGAFLSIEGNTDSSGEGSGRLFFREHNSTTEGADNYGVSFGYRGGLTSVTTAIGNDWTGLSAIGNGSWGLWGHDNDTTGALAMYGPRNGSYVQATGSFRAPIFYDSNNTAYYVDPASTSNLNAVTVGSLDASGELEGQYIGVGNSSSSTGHGLSLYNGGVAGQPTYGIMFAGTSTFGTYGPVTSDWATYFTMNNTANRGWVFRDVSNGRNVAAISNSGHAQIAGALTIGVDLRAPVFYDSTNTGYYVDPASTCVLNAVKFYGDFYHDTSNRDNGMYGSYDSTKTDHIWSMGTSYRNSAAGTNFGNLYGLAYKHTNNTTGGTMAGGHMMVWCQNGTGTAAMGSSIWTSGNVTAYSDRRVKTNLEVIPDALNKIKALTGYTFDRTDVRTDEITGEDLTVRRQTGLIAQDLLPLLPEAVTGNEKDHYSIAYGHLAGLFVEAIKEQQTIIDELKERINKLEGN